MLCMIISGMAKGKSMHSLENERADPEDNP